MSEIRETGVVLIIDLLNAGYNVHIIFERNDKSLRSKSDSERSSVYTND